MLFANEKKQVTILLGIPQMTQLFRVNRPMLLKPFTYWYWIFSGYNTRVYGDLATAKQAISTYHDGPKYNGNTWHVYEQVVCIYVICSLTLMYFKWLIRGVVVMGVDNRKLLYISCPSIRNVHSNKVFQFGIGNLCPVPKNIFCQFTA